MAPHLKVLALHEKNDKWILTYFKLWWNVYSKNVPFLIISWLSWFWMNRHGSPLFAWLKASTVVYKAPHTWSYLHLTITHEWKTPHFIVKKTEAQGRTIKWSVLRHRIDEWHFTSWGLQSLLEATAAGVLPNPSPHSNNWSNNNNNRSWLLKRTHYF